MNCCKIGFLSYLSFELVMSKIYPTDITDNQSQYIEKSLLRKERKRKHDVKEIFNNVF